VRCLLRFELADERAKAAVVAVADFAIKAGCFLVGALVLIFVGMVVSQAPLPNVICSTLNFFSVYPFSQCLI